MQGGSCRDQTLLVAVFAYILLPSVHLIAAGSSAFWADKSVWPTLLKQVCLTGFLRLELRPKLLETYPTLLAHVRLPPFIAVNILPLL